MKKTAIMTIGATLLWSGLSHASGPQPGQWFVSPMVTGIVADDARIVDDDIRGGQLGLGYAVDSSWLVEGNVQYNDLTGWWPAEQWGVNVDLLRRWREQERVSPYLAFGAGWLRTRSDVGLGRRNDHSLSVGPGVMIGVTDNVALRGDYRLRFDLDNPILKDQLFSVGLVFSFGAARTPVAAAPPPAPPAQPPAATPPAAPQEPPCPQPAAGQPADEDGCALPVVLSDVLFPVDSAELLPAAGEVLERAAATLREHTHLRLEIRGHSDNTGSAEYNLELSERRAETVRQYLIDQGVPAGNLSAVGFGEEQPIASNDTPAGRTQNRRVELHFIVD